MLSSKAHAMWGGKREREREREKKKPKTNNNNNNNQLLISQHNLPIRFPVPHYMHPLLFSNADELPILQC
jgi:hypothetical protein